MEKNTAQPELSHVEDQAEGSVAAPDSKVDSHEEQPREFRWTFGLFMAMLSFQFGYLSDGMILIMLSNALQTINRDIGPSTSYVWILTAISVAGAAVSPIIGRFSDIYGRRKFLLVGNALGVIGTAVAATANSVNVMIIGTAFIGVATAMRQLAWVCLAEIVPRKARGFAFGLLAQSLSVSSAFGPVMAYGFISNGSWRPVFWLPFAMDAFALVLVFFYYRPMNQYIHEEGKTTWQQLKESDFIGVFLYMAGVVIFLLGISFGGQRYPWKSAGTIAPIILGFLTLVACGVYEAYAKPKWAIFPSEIFRNIRGFVVLQIATFVIGMLYYSIAVLWPTQVAALYATDPLTIGWYSSATGFGGFVFAPIAGYLQLKLRRSHIQLVVYTVLMTLFTGLLAISTEKTKVSSTAFVTLSYGMVAFITVFTLSMIMVGVKHEHIGIANGIIVTSRTLGGAVATTIYLSILNNELASKLVPNVAVPLATAGVSLTDIPSIILALTTGDITSPALASLSPELLLLAVNGLKQSFVSAFRLVYLVSIAFGGVGIVVVAFAANVDHLMTDTIDTRLMEGAHVIANTDTGEGHIIHASEKSEI